MSTKQAKLKTYYKQHFPIVQIYQMLNYNKEFATFKNREFSFVIKGDVYLRYKSFENYLKLKEFLLESVPDKIDLGAMYNVEPINRKKMKDLSSFCALSKELVFDIDLTDYDDVRTCCQQDEVCPKCWKLITVAIKIIDEILKDDFGFRKMLWVFSGRRGVHLWVCDEIALRLTNEQRRAIVGYIELVKGGAQQIKKVNKIGKRSIHPRIKQILETHIEESYFEISVKSMEILKTDMAIEYMKNTNIPSIHEIINQQNASSVEISKRLQKAIKNSETSEAGHFLRDFMIQCVYPRLDKNVSIQMSHLLKMPFCVHQKTNKICIPIEVSKAHLFDPNAVPTLDDLVDGLKTDEFEKSIKTFNRFVNNFNV